MIRNMSVAAFAVACLMTAASVHADVELKQNADSHTVGITINGREFSTFNYADSLPKPFMWPVRGSDGTILTRPIITDRTQGDHPHHKGIWVAVDEVGGVQHWAEKGKIANRKVEVTVPSGNPAEMVVVNEWLDEAGAPVVQEATTISVFESGVLAYDIRFTASGDKPVEFGDTKEGLFGFRMVDSMRESEGGLVVNADGGKGTAECWGQPSDWVDYVGEVGGRTFGVTLFDHPLNFRRSRYHVRNYGLFSVSPFGESAYTSKKRPAEEYYLLPGAELRLRYGIYIHDGDTAAADVKGAYLKYLQSGR